MYQQILRIRDAQFCYNVDVASCVQKDPNEVVPQLAHEPFPYVPARSSTEAQSGHFGLCFNSAIKLYSVFSIQCSSNIVEIYAC